MVRIRWTEQSLDDINNIAEFIANDSVRYAKIQVRRFFKSAEVLKVMPEFGRIVPEIGDEKIREIIQGNYRIVYQIMSKREIAILTVHHSSRLLSNNSIFEVNENTSLYKGVNADAI